MIFFSKQKLLLLFTIVCYGYLSAEIRTIYSLEQAQHILESLDDKALVVFDVDETLIIPVDKICRKHPEALVSDIKKNYFHNMIKDSAERQCLDSIIWKMQGQQLIEPMSVALIAQLQAQNIRVIALTHIHAGSYYAIESMQEWRYQQLRDIGIDLAIHNPRTIVFTDLPRGRSSHPVLHKGIFATSRSCTKGQALAQLIKHMGYKPSVIVFFDDYLEHIHTVHEEMTSLNIDCIALHYKATEQMQEEVNREIAIFQYKYLIQNRIWLSDQQAAGLMLSA